MINGIIGTHYTPMQNGSASLVRKCRLRLLVSLGGYGVMCMTTPYQAKKIQDDEDGKKD